ncbi:MAG: hypothetical protein EBV34_21365, partial [Betaproteobacteria bacterium]|nr:hypothetical protein [Betaproteobacteria bacterium]
MKNRLGILIGLVALVLLGLFYGILSNFELHGRLLRGLKQPDGGGKAGHTVEKSTMQKNPQSGERAGQNLAREIA